MQKIKLNSFQYPITRVMRNPITADDKGWGWMLPPSTYTDIHLWGLGMLGTEGRTMSLWAFLVQTCSVHVKVDGSANSLPHLGKEVFVHAWHLPASIRILEDPLEAPYPFSSLSVFGNLCFLRTHCFCQLPFTCFCSSPAFSPSHRVCAHWFYGHAILSYFPRFGKGNWLHFT